ncbi:BTB/POZ domain-containing protein NPY2-like [Iris pallida]|uniref:BTB/POZ domain-containing protein NPY2-like n=1 Tax=Iris pallida TaxID=29817 RepID=A0AAX6F300_IRIPA|nr:BTB/POZ domain-containing protein NPY2-like [Iris pallida]KAJ6810518.1 BTB/POZ domain-containing protein NPY2-like [Iris pallida]
MFLEISKRVKEINLVDLLRRCFRVTIFPFLPKSSYLQKLVTTTIDEAQEINVSISSSGT